MWVVEIQKLPEEPSTPTKNEEVAYEPKFLTIPLASLIPAERASVISKEPVVPNQILLGTVRDGRLRVQSPLTVTFTREGQHIIAEAVELDEFGFGTSFSEALRDLQGAIVELYFTLEKEQDRLGPDLQKVRATLQHKLLRRP